MPYVCVAGLVTLWNGDMSADSDECFCVFGTDCIIAAHNKTTYHHHLG